MPFHGSCPFLREALDSLAAQGDDLNVLLIDDRAAMEARLVAERYCSQRERWSIRRAPSVGIAGALAFGVGIIDTPYIGRLDADDRALPGRFEEQLRFLERTPHAALVGSQVEYIDVAGVPTGRQSRYATDPNVILNRLRWECPIAHPSVLMKREAAIAAGSYRDVFSGSGTSAEDFDLWIRLARYGQLHVLDRVLTQYRIHGGQVSNRHAYELALTTLGVAINGQLEARGEHGVGASLPVPLDGFRRTLASRSARRALLRRLQWQDRRRAVFDFLVAEHRYEGNSRLPVPVGALVRFPVQLTRAFLRARLPRLGGSS